MLPRDLKKNGGCLAVFLVSEEGQVTEQREERKGKKWGAVSGVIEE